MKKWLTMMVVVLTFVCMLACVACGGNGDKPQTPSQQPTWEDEPIENGAHDGIELPELDRE